MHVHRDVGSTHPIAYEKPNGEAQLGRYANHTHVYDDDAGNERTAKRAKSSDGVNYVHVARTYVAEHMPEYIVHGMC